MSQTNTVTKQRLTTGNTPNEQQSNALRPYKRSPALSNPTWYKGMLHSQMAGTTDNKGAFDFIISTIRRGTEPPPQFTRERMSVSMFFRAR